MFLYSRCTNGFHVICGVFCCRITLGRSQRHSEPPYACRSTSSLNNVLTLLCLEPKLFIVYHIYIYIFFVALCGIWFMYHSYMIEFIGYGIFWCYDGSFGSSSSHFTYFFKGVWPSINGSTCCSYLLGMLGYDHFCTSHSFLTRWSPLFFHVMAHVEIGTFPFKLAPKFYYSRLSIFKSLLLKVLWCNRIFTFKFFFRTTYMNKK